ncbi:MAG: hypothetical protein LBC65_05325 [Oscillospiraceae bacterium]|jgi:stage IV sporulation protein FB|nr:hypothetical protein [Oscillospiraceae bacterium]
MRIGISAGFGIVTALLLFLGAGDLLGLFLLAAAIHELGHLAAIALCRARLTQIRLELSGVAIYYDHSEVGYVADALIAFAGPLAGAIAAIAAAWLGFEQFAGISLVLSAVNLLPAIPLDGGVILRSLLTLAAGERPAILTAVHCMTCFGLLMLGLYVLYVTGGNFTCLLMAICLLVLPLIRK